MQRQGQQRPGDSSRKREPKANAERTEDQVGQPIALAVLGDDSLAQSERDSILGNQPGHPGRGQGDQDIRPYRQHDRIIEGTTGNPIHLELAPVKGLRHPYVPRYIDEVTKENDRERGEREERERRERILAEERARQKKEADRAARERIEKARQEWEGK